MIDNFLKEKAGAVLDFISALALLGRPIANNFETRAQWCHYAGGFRDGDNLLPGVGFDKSADDLHVWVTLDRLKITPPPALPTLAPLARWKGEIKIPDTEKREPKTPEERTERFASREEVEKLLESGMLNAEHISEPSEGGAVYCRFLWSDDEEAREAWERYLREQWRPWQQKEIPVRKQTQIYRQFHDISKNSNVEDFPLEVVFGVGVAQRWSEGKIAVRNPVLEQIAEVKLVDQTGRILIYPRPGRRPMVSLESFQDDAASMQQVKKILSDDLARDDYALNIFDPDTFSPVIATARARLDPQAQEGEGRFYNPDEKPERLTFYSEWAVYIRRRDDSFFTDVTARKMKEKIGKAADAKELPGTIIDVTGGMEADDSPPAAPPPLPPEHAEPAREPAAREHRYLPLPYNKEQEGMIDALSSAGCKGIVVQGPPGTGKSHTIANIICHCLATGKRVLVASHDTAALKVLESKIPENIRGLTIPVLDSSNDGKEKTEKAVNQLIAIQATNDADTDDAIARGKREEAMARKEIEQTEQDLKVLFDRQTQPPPEFLAEHLTASSSLPKTAMLARWIDDNAGEHSWFSDRPETRGWDSLPFGDDEITQLRGVRARLGGDLRHLGKALPENLPSQQTVRDWHEILRQAAQIEERITSGEIRRFAVTTGGAVEQAESVREKLSEMESAYTDAAAIPWIEELRANGGDNYRARRADIKTLRERGESIVSKGAVSCPDRQVVVDNMPKIVNALKKKSGGGIALSAWFPTQTKKIIGEFAVNERAPRTKEEWGYVLDFAEWLALCHDFAAQWNAAVAVQISGGDVRAPGLEGIAEWLRKTDNAITGAESVERLAREVEPQLAELFVGATLDDIARVSGVRKVIRDIDENLAKIKCEQARESIKAGEETLGDAEIGGEMRAFFKTVGAQNIDGQSIMQQWDDLVNEANRLHGKKDDFQSVARIAGLIEEGGAAEWADMLRRQLPQDDGDAAIPANWRDAWLWGCANAWLDSIESGEQIKTHLADLRRADDRRKKALGGIVEWQAKKCLKNNLMRNQGAARNLQNFATLVANAPKGRDTKKGPIYQKLKADAMEQCYGVIPCWIMPSWRANEMLPADYCSFDLVVMDEASQSDAKELLTLMRGRQVLVVGDEKQVSPTSFADVNQTQKLIGRHLLPLPPDVRATLRPEISLYQIARGIFPGTTIMLKEHFRCAEPVIAFSSREFYENKIKPLRVPKSTERITPPLVDVYVRNGVEVARKNEAEAAAIVGEIEKLRDAPETRDRSIGVISLVGHDQARHISNMLVRRLGINHNVVCGGAATFQGSEYDIVFLSMVVSAAAGALTTKIFEQRFNVAASRARDRLYLYRSIREQDLQNPKDMRLRLIKHFKNPLPGVENRALREACESRFEEEVFDRLVKRGYAAAPQVGARGYRIDIVVEGENGNRLAVELDGDSYHQQWEKDFARQQTLERVGWHFWRCFASAYYRDKDGVFQSLLDELAARGIHPWQRNDAAVTTLVEHREIDGMPEAQDSDYTDGADSARDEPADDGGGDEGDSGESAPVALPPKPAAGKLF